VDLQEVEFDDVDWIYLAEDGDGWWASVKRVMNREVV
jgi:hypothetical protein